MASIGGLPPAMPGLNLRAKGQQMLRRHFQIR